MVVDLDKPTRSDPAELRTWQSRQFFGARIETLRARLSEPNLTKFNAMTYAGKVIIVARMIERGHMI